MKKFTILAVASALALGTVASVPAMAKKDKEEQSEEHAPVSIGEPEAGKGQIVFFRSGGMGFAMGCGVNENDVRVSALGAGKYFVIQTEPGTHTYTAKSESKDVLTLEIDPGETYYVRCTIKMGIMVGRPNLSPSTKEEFDKASSKLKYVDADDFGPKK